MSMTMLESAASTRKRPVVYPDCDGNLMSDSTTHGDAIQYFHGLLEVVLADNPNAFAAADHLWYYREGDPKSRVAPDVYAVYGRPKHHRGSYKQWEEEGIAPQIVFKVISPQNRRMTAYKDALYNGLGVEEYYVYDPGYNSRGDLNVENRSLRAFRRNEAGETVLIKNAIGTTSARLGIGFAWDDLGLLRLLLPDGSTFPRYAESVAQAAQAASRVNALEAKLAKLRAAGVDVDGITGST